MVDDSLDTQRQAVFLQLKPLCVSLIQSTSVSASKSHETFQTIDNLLNILYSIPDPSRIFDYNLIKYVYFPLLQLYNNPILRQSNRFIEGFLNCLHFLLTASWKKYMVPDQFKQLLLVFVNIIGGSTLDSKTVNRSYLTEFTISEESKLACVKCMLALLPVHTESFENVDNRDHFQIEIRRELILQELMSIQVRALIGRCVYVLLEIISNENLLQLRLTSLETMQSLVDSIEDLGIIAAFLPGMVSTLCKTLIRDQKENHMLLAKIVETLSVIITSVMNDNDEVNKSLFTITGSLSDLKDLFHSTDSFSNQTSSSLSKTTSTQTSQSQQSALASIYVERTKSWLRATKSQIKLLMCQIFTIRNHSAWQLRLAFVNFSYKLLSSSAKCLDNCIPILIETLVFYLNDNYVQVSNPCRQNLDLLRAHSDFRENFTPILKENFNNWLISLPRYLIGLDENAKYNALSLIAGFISLLGSDIQTVLNISLQRVSDGLLNALEFDTGDVRVVENRLLTGQYDTIENESAITTDAAFQDSERTLPHFPQPQYKHIREQRVKTCLSTVFRLLGYFSNISFLIDHFLAYFRDQESTRLYAQCIFILKEILLGAAGINMRTDLNFEYYINLKPVNALRDVKRIARSILKEYIESDVTLNIINNFDSTTKAVSNKSNFVERKILSTSNMNVESQNRIILIDCFILEGIAAISHILGREFRVELIDALYPILEKLGENNRLVHETADITLTHVSVWCGYSSKRALVLENVDYLVNVVSRKLSQIIVNPRTPQVLTAMIRVVGPPLLTFLDDSIEEIFDALDAHHMNSYLLNQLANVLFAVIVAISESVEGEKKELQEEVDDNSSSQENEVGISIEIAEFVKQYKKGETPEVKNPNYNATLEEIGQYFLKRQKSKENLKDELEVDDDDIQREHEPSVNHHKKEDKDNKPKPTQSQSTCLQIIDKLLHFLAAASPQLRSIVLDAIRISLPILQSIPKELYPLIHRIWPSVVKRLKDQESYVVLSAVRLIQGISISSGDFFTSRVVQDVWPSFQQLLDHQDTKDKEYIGISPTTYSRSHRLKKSILETIKTIISKVALSNQVILQIMDHMWPFLNEKVHENLQNLTIELFKELAKRNSNATWLILRGLVEEYSVIPYRKIADEEVELNDIVWPKYLCRFPKGEKKDQFVKNVRLILNENLF
ncbi:11641_t:CDS:2 [Funneliformis mosseae]|uniref:11641_t:CDS:1 n=1 Tax=Funneliformis mosseae TaxID=27381 RepID=A0A9N9DM00_FUNMO|nr:11641_t:CDS:2 [Funneliformis mosseae]